MKIAKNEIAIKLKQLKNVMPPRNSGIAPGVLLENGTLTATDLNLGLTTSMGVSSDETFIIPANAIDLIESLPNENIEMGIVGKQFVVKSGSSRYKFAQISAEDFPRVTFNETARKLFSCKASDFADKISGVNYASMSNNNESIYNGILIESKNGGINIVGCDGYRLAWNYMETNIETDFRLVIPQSSLRKFINMSTDGEATFYSANSQVIIKTEEYTLSALLMTGEFMKYEAAFPKKEQTRITFDRSEFLSSVKRFQLVKSDCKQSPVVVGCEANKLIVGGSSSVTEFYEEVPATDLPESMRIGFNAKFLSDALNSFNVDELHMSYTADTAPVVLTDGTLKAMILPVRLKEARV